MKRLFEKAAMIAALTTVSLAASAAQVDIRVWADVDNTLTLLRADGSALPDAVKLPYSPVNGLAPWTERVKIFTNDASKDVQVRLQGAAELKQMTGLGGKVIPLKVTLDGKTLTTTATDFAAKELFPGGKENMSGAMDLRIAQTTAAQVTPAGAYEGLVSIVVNAKP